MFGIAVLASVFTANGGYSSGKAYIAGLTPALWIGAVIVALGALAALFIPGRRPTEVPAQGGELTVEAILEASAR